MGVRRFIRPALAGVMLVAGLSGASAAQGPAALTALKGVETGQWQLKDGDGARKLCLSNPSELIQLRHPGAQCSHFVVENSKETATVHYTCPGHGYGRTTISVETPRLIHVDTQGVIDGSPFAEDYEGRKLGACS